MTVRLTRVDVADLDLATAGELAAIDNAALDGVPLRHHTAETFLLECRDRSGEGPDTGFWLAHDDGRLVGYAALTLNLFENLDGAKILGAVHPDHQRRGIGRALLGAAEAATDRPRLRAPAWAGTAGERAVPRFGYTPQGAHEVRRLELRDEQPPTLAAEAEGAGRDYELERFRGACPDELLADMQVLREAINDAPEGGEYEAFPPNRIRGYEASLARGRQTPYTIVARHRGTGEAAGITIVCVHELRPDIAAQEDTSVLAPHRGHRLGLRLKLAMLDWLRAERTDVASVDTWNVPGNAPMIAINDALGCRKVAATIAFRKAR
ncbi:MAG TPA: GNAT family N-acetyltransferase [Nocardioides sp.]|nr:GNAT family N-acetyltransferase [Nocardioides sp.]